MYQNTIIMGEKLLSRHSGYTLPARRRQLSAWVDVNSEPHATTDMLIIYHFQRFCKEFVTWKSLRHPNVLALVGVVMTETEFSMVSEWMPNGNLSRFVREHPRENRFTLVSFCPNY